MRGSETMASKQREKHPWLKIKINTNDNYRGIKKMLKARKLHTVCEEARCPNIHECWGARKTATFMILGDICTRSCKFCAVKTGLPTELDLQEPENVAESVKEMGLHHAVITSVARDDLKDGGAQIFADTIKAIRRLSPITTVEVLPSDLMGDINSLQLLMDARPDILNHNIETVRRLSDSVRAKAKYVR